MWICCQIGAREHYAIPRALGQIGRSVKLYTDFWANPAVRKLSFGKLRLFGTRYHPDLESSNGVITIKSWNLPALFWEKRLRSIAAGKTPYHGFIEVGQRFAIRVREALKQRSDLDSNAIFFSYDTGALEAMQWCRERGIKCVLNQMDPNRVEVDLVRAEEKRWSNWAKQPAIVPKEYFRRREAEWALADRIVVNSEFCRRALVRQGVPSEKLTIIPLCYEAAGLNRKLEIRNRESGQPLRVLFLGQVILRKGIQYLMEAARLLVNENIHFDVVGTVGISAEALSTVPRNMTFHGRVARDQAGDWYQQADLFVLPTLSDGFALTQLEAMAHGLPVVTTPCCGDVVGSGVDGFIVPPRDAEALAQTFLRYLSEPELRRQQSAAALTKAGQFSLPRLAANLKQLETELLK